MRGPVCIGEDLRVRITPAYGEPEILGRAKVADDSFERLPVLASRVLREL